MASGIFVLGESLDSSQFYATLIPAFASHGLMVTDYAAISLQRSFNRNYRRVLTALKCEAPVEDLETIVATSLGSVRGALGRLSSTPVSLHEDPHYASAHFPIISRNYH